MSVNVNECQFFTTASVTVPYPFEHTRTVPTGYSWEWHDGRGRITDKATLNHLEPIREAILWVDKHFDELDFHGRLHNGPPGAAPFPLDRWRWDHGIGAVSDAWYRGGPVSFERSDMEAPPEAFVDFKRLVWNILKNNNGVCSENDAVIAAADKGIKTPSKRNLPRNESAQKQLQRRPNKTHVFIGLDTPRVLECPVCPIDIVGSLRILAI